MNDNFDFGDFDAEKEEEQEYNYWRVNDEIDQLEREFQTYRDQPGPPNEYLDLYYEHRHDQIINRFPIE